MRALLFFISNKLRANPLPFPPATLPAIDSVGVPEELVDLGGEGVKAVFQCRQLHPQDEGEED